MLDSERIHLVFEQATSLCELDLVQADPSVGLWHLIADGTEMQIELDETRGLLVLTSALVEVPSEVDRAFMLEFLLRHGAAWEASGGSRVALNGAQGIPTLLRDVGAVDLTPDRLARQIEEFCRQAAAWTDLIAAGPGAFAGCEMPFGKVGTSA